MAGFSHPLCQIVLPLACADAVAFASPFLTYVQRNDESRVRLFGFSGCTFVSVRRNRFAISTLGRLEDSGRHVPMMNPLLARRGRSQADIRGLFRRFRTETV
jgi:hypothetical protein